MARLVHLNGPPGVGKSTIARQLAAATPKALALDADAVVAMLGGWQDDFWGTLPLARGLAAGMAREHLAGGHDVFLPQLVTNEEEIAPYLAAAEAAGAGYVEVLLLADLPAFIERFSDRADPVGRHVARIVAADGGNRLLAKIHDDLMRYVEGRDAHLTVDTSRLTATEAFRAVETALQARR